MDHKDFFHHETAIIDPGATIGSQTRIWHFCHIMSGATIGDNCTLGQNVFVADRVQIGNGCKIQNNVSLYSGVICEDEVFLGPSMVFTNILYPRSAVNRRDQFLTTLVRKGATIGANATILCGTTIGKYALIGAGAVVTESVPDYGLVIGNPARQAGWVSKYGRHLYFDAQQVATCPESGEVYQLIDGMVQPVNNEG